MSCNASLQAASWEGHDFMPDTRKLEGWIIPTTLVFQVQGPRLLRRHFELSGGLVGQEKVPSPELEANDD